MEDTLNPLQQIAVAAGLGFLVGLQREWAKPEMAGIRTFPLITVFGAISALLSQHIGGWIVAASVVALTGMVIVSNVANLRKGEIHSGLTTEMAILVMFGVGALLVFDYTIPAVVIGGGLAVLLYWKQPLHGLVAKIGDADSRAIARLILVALVILPVLPNRTFGPFDVLNPFQIWLMVVLIVGISVGAYVVQRVVGTRTGALVMGGLGGLVSSTAATIAYARDTHRHRERAPLMAFTIMVASCVVLARVLFELAVVASSTWSRTAPPLITMMFFMVLITGFAYWSGRSTVAELPAPEAPNDLKAPIAFGLLYAVVLFLVAAAQERFGVSGMFAIAAFSGLTDMDAITLSTAQLVNNQRISPEVGWKLILVAAMTNIAFKGIAVAVVGNTRLALRVALLFAASLVGAAGILWFW